MNREELKKEAQEQVNYCTPLYPESFIQGYLAGAEPRENKIADIKANCDFAIEGRDIKIKELEQQIEKLLDFVVERTVCCDVCPSSDTCRNDEGTCPHAGLLKENEEKVTMEWILKSITKE